MEVLIKLSDKTLRYIQYIPQEMVSDILSDILAEAIENKSYQVASTAEQTISMNAIEEVVSLLKQVTENGVRPQVVENKETKVDKPKKTPKKVIALDTSVDLGDMDDDLLDMLK
ncbi:hypothetical protein [Bacteroides acidifaciens]|uniref:hypothetical protein n=1 Tax=Bacteroides acidifaciens TaxID=85831 RepID=UPI0025AA2B05|nr:hypothetical protein [Bacteroides acidifaciens]